MSPTPDPADPPPGSAGSAAAAPPAALAAVMRAHAHVAGQGLGVKAVDTGQYVWANDAMAAILGAGAAADLIGRTDGAIVGAARAAALRAADETALSAWPDPTTSEHRFEWDARRLRHQVTRIAVPEAPGGAPRWLAMVWVDLAAQQDRQAALERALRQLEAEQATQRQLREQLASQAPSPWPSARGTPFEEQLRREADLSSREQRDFSLVLIELDPLSVQDLPDPSIARSRAADALDRLLLTNIRAMDATSRLGEDRFSILLSGVGLATAHARIEGLRRQCATQVLALDGREIGFTISVGVASFPHTASSRSGLVEAATGALAEARSRGGNQVRLAAIRFAAS